MNLQTVVASLSAHKQSLSARYPIKSIAVFGSVAREDARPESDVDIMVEFDQPIGIEFVDLAEELEQMLGMKVDLVSRKAIRPEVWSFIESDLCYV